MGGGGGSGGGTGGGRGSIPARSAAADSLPLALCRHHCDARDLPVIFHPDVADHGPVPVKRVLPLLCPLVFEWIGVLHAAEEVGCFILVGYVHPEFFRCALALVEHSGVLTEVHVWRVGPRGKEGSPDIQLLFVEDSWVRLELLNHQARRLVDVTDIFLVVIGKVLVVGVRDDSGDAVEVYRLFDVVLVPSDPMLRGEDRLGCGGGGVHNVWV